MSVFSKIFTPGDLAFSPTYNQAQENQLASSRWSGVVNLTADDLLSPSTDWILTLEQAGPIIRRSGVGPLRATLQVVFSAAPPAAAACFVYAKIRIRAAAYCDHCRAAAAAASNRRHGAAVNAVNATGAGGEGSASQRSIGAAVLGAGLLLHLPQLGPLVQRQRQRSGVVRLLKMREPQFFVSF